MNGRVPPKSRRWAPRIQQVEAQSAHGDVSSHLGGQFGFAGWRTPGNRSVRGGYPSEVRLEGGPA